MAAVQPAVFDVDKARRDRAARPGLGEPLCWPPRRSRAHRGARSRQVTDTSSTSIGIVDAPPGRCLRPASSRPRVVRSTNANATGERAADPPGRGRRRRRRRRPQVRPCSSAPTARRVEHQAPSSSASARRPRRRRRGRGLERLGEVALESATLICSPWATRPTPCWAARVSSRRSLVVDLGVDGWRDDRAGRR